MGCDTNLLINTKWHPEDIVKLLEHLYPGCNPKESPTHTSRLVNIMFSGRMINFWYGFDTGIGLCNQISLSMDDEAIKIMRSIAGRIGGLLQANDSNETYEAIYGLDWIEDGKCYEFHQWLLKGDTS